LNYGGFAVNINFLYLDADGVEREVCCSGNFETLRTVAASPGDAGVPEGATIRLKVGVIGGRNNLGSERFAYSAQSEDMADYVISGTSLNNELVYRGTRGIRG
ncbi:MAG TPA: hypothetical protein VJN44_03835, partial [Roseateles sp.]|nr:hypothetical protein [Roseateles sp.]